MEGRARLELAARVLQPIQQGQLDGLCGLYSIINAVRLALWPDRRLGKRELHILFAAGLQTLNHGRSLTTVVRRGMSERLWITVCDAVVYEANALLGTSLKRTRLVAAKERPDRRQVLSRVRRSLRDGCPVLVIVSNSLNHATVMASYTDTRVRLFDSAALHWLSIDAIGLDETRTLKRHRLSVLSASSLVYQT